MNRATVAVGWIGIGLATSLLAGCGASERAATPAAATSAASDQTARTISTRGLGVVTGTPDTLDLVIGVQTSASTAADALAADNTKAAALIASLLKGGVAKADLQTTQLEIQPTYADKSVEITGYQVSNTVRATLHNLTSAGTVIDDAARAAGDAARVQEISFSIGDDSALLAQARVQAVKQAKTQATAMAAAAGTSVARVRTISEVTSGGVPITYNGAAASSAAAAVPLEAGSQQLSVSVDVTYDLS
jgi:uncharacterized protein YggE